MRRLAVAAWLLTLPAGCAPQAIRGALDVDPDPDAPGAPGQVDPEATTPRARLPRADPSNTGSSASLPVGMYGSRS